MKKAKNNTKKNNTIDLTKARFSNIDEIDGVIKTEDEYGRPCLNLSYTASTWNSECRE